MTAQDDDASITFVISHRQSITMSVGTISLNLAFSYRKSLKEIHKTIKIAVIITTYTQKYHELNRRPNKCELIYTLFNSITQSSYVIVSGLHTNAHKIQREHVNENQNAPNIWMRLCVCKCGGDMRKNIRANNWMKAKIK